VSTFVADDWRAIFTRLNALLLKSNEWKEKLTPEALSSHWCGLPPATEGEITKAERHLGVKLPPSYRSFLAISNGWRPFSHFVERLLPVVEVEPYRTVDPEALAMIRQYYLDNDLPDKDYLDYATPEHMVALRTRYYPDCLLVGKSWGVEDDMILLNPHITFPDGEWEAIFFANWIPGNQRYRSFYDLVVASVDTSERIERTKSS
jgi:SMI1 / KNR4 family (SUKH-1)